MQIDITTFDWNMFSILLWMHAELDVNFNYFSKFGQIHTHKRSAWFFFGGFSYFHHLAQCALSPSLNVWFDEKSILIKQYDGASLEQNLNTKKSYLIQCIVWPCEMREYRSHYKNLKEKRMDQNAGCWICRSLFSNHFWSTSLIYDKELFT